MISETAGGGVIRQDVQEAIERELNYRLGQGDATGAPVDVLSPSGSSCIGRD